MIKRRFYSSDSSSSSSDSDSDSFSDNNSEPEIEEEEDVAVEKGKNVKKKKNDQRRRTRSPSPASSGSGYESEDSSVNELKVDASGLLTSEDGSIERGDRNLIDGNLFNKADAKESDEEDSNANDVLQGEFADCVLRCKSVFKCRLCPRIICLNEGSLKIHLNSKRHARSKKLLNEGRLKFMLNSDGEIEEDLETHEERHIRTLAIAQEPVAPAKRSSGRKRQSLRRKRKQLKQKSKESMDKPQEKSEDSAKNPQKKRRKNKAEEL